MTDTETKPKRPGRKPQYKPEIHDDLARGLRLLGFSNRKIATALGLDETSIRRFIRNHPSFAEAIRQGGDLADAHVASRLYQRALSGDVRACAYWLERRQPALWRQPEKQPAPAPAAAPDEHQDGYPVQDTTGLPSEREIPDDPPIVTH